MLVTTLPTACGSDGPSAEPGIGNSTSASATTVPNVGGGGSMAPGAAGRAASSGAANAPGSAPASGGAGAKPAGPGASMATAMAMAMGAAPGPAGAGTAAPASAAGGVAPASAAGTAASAAGAAGSGASSAPAVACDPADKMADPTPASFKWISGYSNLSKEPTTGPSKPVLEVHPGFPDWTIYRPETLSAETPHPIMIWAEGGCLRNSTIQGPALLELASWNFVVVADGKPQDTSTGADPAAGGIRSGPMAEPMIMAMDWITAENERPCSMFYHKLDVEKIGTGGQSCGGMMTMLSAGDKRVTTPIVANSGVSGNNNTLFTSYHAPMLFMAGGSSDFLSSSATANVNAINNVPIFYGNQEVGHGGTWEDTNGGEFGRVMLGWLKWQLRGDSAAEKMFKGADCELCKDSKWTIQKKMLD